MLTINTDKVAEQSASLAPSLKLNVTRLVQQAPRWQARQAEADFRDAVRRTTFGETGRFERRAGSRSALPSSASARLGEAEEEDEVEITGTRSREEREAELRREAVDVDSD